MEAEEIPVVVTPLGSGLKLVFHGSLTAQREWLRAELDRVVKGRPSNVQIDLKAVENITSEGIGILVDFRNRIVAGGGGFKTVAVHPKVLEVLKLSALLKFFNIEGAGGAATAL